MEQIHKVANLYIATLKAISLIHQHNHWTTQGESFYGDHLLFERLYNSVLKNLDAAAEKFIGLLGNSVLDYDLQIELLGRILSRYSALEGSPAQMSLAVEKEFLKLTSSVYGAFEEADRLTLGLDDFLMSVASQREEAVYLLKQKIAND